jgi:hypothetical protein
MRKAPGFILSSLLFAFICIRPSSAQTVKNIFAKETPITYLGIDFTQARVIGEATDANDIRDRQFPEHSCSENQVGQC